MVQYIYKHKALKEMNMKNIEVYEYVVNQLGTQVYQALRTLELLKKNEPGHINRDDMMNLAYIANVREEILNIVESKLNTYMKDLHNDVRERRDDFIMEEYSSDDDIDEAM